MDRVALAGFLRVRRESLRPGDVGLAAGARRRTKGLRREEVAALAVMSTDYYTRLEQQRGPQPSEQMLTALSRALQLTSGERDYLFQVAGRSPARSAPDGTHVAAPLLRVLNRLTDTPALIISNLAETLAQNSMAAALLGDASGRTGWERSDIYRWFTDAGERRRYPAHDQDRQGRALAATLRATLGAQGPSSRAAELVRLLCACSAEFAAIWERHEVAQRFADHKTLIHPQAGSISLDCQVLFTEDQSQALLVLTASPETESWAKLTALRDASATPVPSEDGAAGPVRFE